ncbi:MAG: response regulator, partial [bacterium]|nr:response regulator [bacterium]
MELLVSKLGMENRIRNICEKVKHNLLLKEVGVGTTATKELLEKTKRHGTTILALKCDEGIIMASDRRCMSGGVIFCDDIVKIEEVGALSCMGGAGYVSITSTRDPTEVCGLHLKNCYDLILLDLQMPGMDGFQVMEGLKTIETDGYLPVHVITAQPAHKQRALEAGAKD